MSEKENELSEDYETEENIEQGEDSAEDMTEDKELSEGEGETESSEVDEDESGLMKMMRSSVVHSSYMKWQERL